MKARADVMAHCALFRLGCDLIYRVHLENQILKKTLKRKGKRFEIKEKEETLFNVGECA